MDCSYESCFNFLCNPLGKISLETEYKDFYDSRLAIDLRLSFRLKMTLILSIFGLSLSSVNKEFLAG